VINLISCVQVCGIRYLKENMGTDVISSLAGSLDAELQKARDTLQGVDENIRKVFGKDVSELQAFGK